MSFAGSFESIGDIAIIGMALRFPGAKNIDGFWQNLQNGVESISHFNEQDREIAGIQPNLAQMSGFVNAGFILDDIDLFDAPFFGMLPREAEILDPQQRIFLECAWEVLENAGYNPETCQESIGIFAGTYISTYLLFNLSGNQNLVGSLGDLTLRHANDKDYLATRVSYKFNLKGPSVTVQTSCSTALVSVHLAVQSLLNHECDVALAGGVSITVPEKTGYIYQEGGILSPDGHCRAFDAQAQGTVFGNGAGIVALKRLKDAVADGDHIHAVIKGSAINNDGSLKVSYTAPSVTGQAKVIAEALAISQVDPDTIGYIETHGTGTPLGDPVEIAGLTQVFREYTQRKGFCPIGSVKTNVGHLGVAAGIAGLIKAVLSIEHGIIPPSLHFNKPNPQIDFENSPFYVNAELAQWPHTGTPRRAGVSSFGMGGTNAHLILEQAPDRQAAQVFQPSYLLTLSARSEQALEQITANLIDHARRHSHLNLADVAYTLQVGRKAFGHRRIVVATDLTDAITVLETRDDKRVKTAVAQQDPPLLVFMFPGQGAQHTNMGLELYQTEPIFRREIDQCAQLLESHLGFDIRTVLYPTVENALTAARQLEQTLFTQPAMFVVSYALAQLWQSWNIKPHAMIGHSLGEYVAATLAGVFSLPDALALVAVRGQLMQSLPDGVMLSVPLSEPEVSSLLGTDLSLAAVNAPDLCVLSGTKTAIKRVEMQLAAQGLKTRRLKTSHAFHSSHIESIQSQFTELVTNSQLNSPTLPFISGVTGTWITNEQATDPEYWVQHLRQPVRFAQGVSQFFQDAHQILLEVGPGQVLSALTERHNERPSAQTILSPARYSQQHKLDRPALLNTLGQLWLAGIAVDWSGVYTHEQRQHTPLPTYPFQHQRYWINPQKNTPVHAMYQEAKQSDQFYTSSWTRTEPIYERNAPLQVPSFSPWLVFMHPNRLSTKIVQHLHELGYHTITVTPGQQFTINSENNFAIHPQQPEHYYQLLSTLHTANQMPSRVVHLWTLTDHEQIGENLDEQQGFSVYSLQYLSKAVNQYSDTDKHIIKIISNGVQMVTGEESLVPEKATLLGACKTLTREYPNITYNNIDVVMPSSQTWQEELLIDALLAELTSHLSNRFTAYRGNHRWVQTAKPIQLKPLDGAHLPVPPDGVYLITGGVNTIALELGQYLAAMNSATVIFVIPATFPKSKEWPAWLADHPASDITSDNIKQLQALKTQSSTIQFVQVDTTCQEQMQTAMAQVQEQFGSINGVIYTDLTSSSHVFDNALPDLMTDKIRETRILETLFANKPLAFFAFCTTRNTMTNSAYLIEETAVATLLTAFSHSFFSRYGIRTNIIHWPPWQIDDMGAENAASSSEVISIFWRILTSSNPEVTVRSQNPTPSGINQPAHSLISTQNEVLESNQISNSLDISLFGLQTMSREEIHQTITETWQSLSGIDQIAMDDDFFELGGDSVLALRLISQLRETFQIELPLNTLFETPTITGLVDFIISSYNQQDQLEQLLMEIENLSPELIEQEFSNGLEGE